MFRQIVQCQKCILFALRRAQPRMLHALDKDRHTFFSQLK